MSEERIERYIGVVYLRETEIVSHYVSSAIGQEYDVFIWLEQTQAVEPLGIEGLQSLPEEHPFGI
jgi:erythromycin esterase-like protein